LAAGNVESALFKRWAAALLAHKCQIRVRRTNGDNHAGSTQERQARPLVVGCSTETGSYAGKVFLRASSRASSWRLGLCELPCSVRGRDDWLLLVGSCHPWRRRRIRL